jgi:hypothetical protein
MRSCRSDNTIETTAPVHSATVPEWIDAAAEDLNSARAKLMLAKEKLRKAK